MKIQNVNAIQYRSIHTKGPGLLNLGDEDQKADKTKSNDYNYNKNIAGQGNEESETNEESNENQDKITSKIVVNSSGMRTLLMLRNSKVFSSVDLGMSDGILEEPTKDEVSDETLAEQFNFNLESNK
ncbi:hypothetical protein QJS64_21335 (plasmid) [Paraclostridium bifermentans]|uniref:Uncharacterized protein n=1 Tax=Paraclostridium bifermentans TaxID=1490 RepID=A0ABY8RB24_PARBF|nr:hypothetical protein QJS64_21335 [Paraclostridium bifermentans]